MSRVSSPSSSSRFLYFSVVFLASIGLLLNRNLVLRALNTRDNDVSTVAPAENQLRESYKLWPKHSSIPDCAKTQVLKLQPYPRSNATVVYDDSLQPWQEKFPKWKIALPKPGTQQFYKGLFVDERNRFAFCPIFKNACSQWYTFLGKLFRNNNNVSMPAFGVNKGSLQTFFTKHNDSVHELEAFLQSRNTTVAMFVRDPLARFKSVFTNKCFRENCDNAWCFARKGLGVPPGEPITFRQAIQYQLSERPHIGDPHYTLQSSNCGIGTDGAGLQNFDFVALMTLETLGIDALCLIESAGLQAYNRMSTSIDAEPFWKRDRNQMQKTLSQYTSDLLAKEQDELKKWYSPELARQMLLYYKQDYEIFQIPLPTWIDEATGEWADALFPEKCVWGMPPNYRKKKPRNTTANSR